MRNWFFLPDTPVRNEWWRYVLTVLLVLSGMIGFGSIPFQLARRAKGYSDEMLQEMSMEEINGLFTHNEMLSYQMFPFVVGFGLLLFAIRFNHRRRITGFFTRRPQVDYKRFGVAFAIAGVLQGVFIALDLLSGNSQLEWNFDPSTFFLLLAICVFFIPLQTGFEELLCRGVFLKWTGKATRRGLAVVLANGLIFGALHSMNAEMDKLGWFAMVYYISSGCFAALIAVMDDGIELSWGFHTANNFTGLLIVSNEWQSIPTDALWIDHSNPDITWGLLITLLVIYPLMIFLLARIYRWSNWRERLLGIPDSRKRGA